MSDDRTHPTGPPEAIPLEPPAQHGTTSEKPPVAEADSKLTPIQWLIGCATLLIAGIGAVLLWFAPYWSLVVWHWLRGH
jgi:hypothetical protein